MTERSLALSSLEVPPAGEWQAPAGAWTFLRPLHGEGYWLGTAGAEMLAPGDLLIFAPTCSAHLRASQLGALRLARFQVDPRDVTGLLTLGERDWLAELGRTNGSPVRLLALHPLAQRFGELLAGPAPGAGLATRLGLFALAVACWEELRPVPAPATAVEADAAARLAGLAEGLSLEQLAARSTAELARDCGCSERHLARLVRLRYGRSLRSVRTEQRLVVARELLREPSVKVLDVALESGFRHLGLFNAMFKRRFGLTPSGWRQQQSPAPRRSPVRAGALLLVLVAVGFAGQAENLAPVRAVSEPPKAPATNAPAARPVATFELNSFQVEGNTLLPQAVLDEVFQPYLTNRATLDTLKSALTALKVTYLGRGWVSVSATLPPQQLTNGVVKVAVTEGKLTDIQVVGNRYFSSNNIMASLPSLRTNVYLNSGWFQSELDAANASRDRQIYPVIGPGPEPGTTSLTLKVKDRLPLHGKFEINNKGTIDTPPLRIDASMQYNNLWQADHQIGVQYNFSPQQMKAESQMPRFWNQPLDAAYSGFYRLPLVKTEALLDKPEFVGTDFGYDPVTRRFRAPQATGRPELIVFASGSNQDTGVKLGPLETVADTPLVSIKSQSSGQDLTINQALGGRLQAGLPVVRGVRSSLSFGPDWKGYDTQSFNTNTFYSRIVLTNNNNPVIIERETAFAQPLREKGVNYLPLSLGWNGSHSDKWGSTSFGINQSYNLADLSSYATVGTNRVDGAYDPGNYYVVSPTLVREQRLYQDWMLALRANGQWADRNLISNEQYVLGGTQGVRGYQEGEESGSSGWRVQIEPRTPWFDLGMVDATEPMRVRFSAFTDFGARYFHDVPTADIGVLWGTGVGTQLSISDWLEGRVQFAWALRDGTSTSTGDFNVYFSVALQF